MKVYRQILFIFLLIFSFPFAIEAAMQEQKYTLSIACMFHDEADYLKEWIEYHRLVGVQHFYLYNNNSSDHYSEVLAPYIESGIVDLTNWPSPPDILYTSYQKDAYNHCVKNHKNDSFWIAFMNLSH